MEQNKLEGKKIGIPRLLKFAGHYKILTILSCIFSGISAVLILCPFICLWCAVREAFRVLPNFTALSDTNFVTYAWGAVAFAVIGFIMYYAALLCSHIAAFNIAKNMKKAVLAHLATLPMGFFMKNTSGRLRKIIDENANQTENFLAHQLPDMVGALITPVVILIFLFVFDWRLGFLSLVPLAVGFMIQGIMMSTTAVKYMKQYQDDLEDMNKEAVEYVRGIPVVKVFQQTVYSFKSFYGSIMNYKKSLTSFALACQWPMTVFSTAINATFVFLIPAAILLSGSVADYAGFITSWLFYILITPACGAMINKVMYISTNKMIAEESVRRIVFLLEEKPLPEAERTMIPKDSSISFEQVTFTYEGASEAALSNINIVIPEGKTIAFVGPSGGGKTTVASLIPRFYDVDSGYVKIGGVDVRQIKESVLMDKVAFVFQNTQLFKTSILENIRVGRQIASIEEVWKAVDGAQCRDIIENLPDGLNTIIGAKGTYLSGGEQQRIVLARAILKDAPIIVLDEATAFADAENEYKIQKAFSHLMKGKTVLMIAHRLTTVKNADQIIVLDKGKIVERGNHKELIKSHGMYETMWKNYQRSISWGIRKEDNYVR